MKKLHALLQRKMTSREGFGTLEVVLIIAVLIAIALIFRESIMNFANNLIDSVFDQSIIDSI